MMQDVPVSILVYIVVFDVIFDEEEAFYCWILTRVDDVYECMARDANQKLDLEIELMLRLN